MVLLVLISACNQTQRYTQTSPEIETVKTLIHDYDTKNYDALISHFADTAQVFFNSPNSILAPTLRSFHEMDDANFSARGFLTEGQEYEMVNSDDGKTWVNFWGMWQGTLAANNKVVTLPVHLTIQFENGIAVREYGYWDNAPIVLAIQEIEATSNNVQTVQNAYDFFAKGDIPSFLALLAEKAEWNEAENFIYANGKPYIGGDAIVKGVFEPIGNDWEYWKIKNLQVNELQNGMVLATGRYEAKNKKTGKVLDAQVAHVFTLSNGKIVKFQQYTDTKQAAEAIQ